MVKFRAGLMFEWLEPCRMDEIRHLDPIDEEGVFLDRVTHFVSVLCASAAQPQLSNGGHFVLRQQLADALYCEIEEVGVNKQLGYASPADLTIRSSIGIAYRRMSRARSATSMSHPARAVQPALDLPQSVPMRFALLNDAWLPWMNSGRCRPTSTRGDNRLIRQRSKGS